VGRVDTSRHLNVMLNTDAFSAAEIAENAKLMVRFARQAEHINVEAQRLAVLKQSAGYRARKG